MSQYPHNERGIRHGHGAAAGGATTYGESPASGPAPTTAGHHAHDILNKLDPRVDSTQDRVPVNVPEGTYGPHRSRIANALDPRVDSTNPAHMHAQGAGTQPAGMAGAAMHGAVGGGGAAGVSAPREGTYGPHSSRVANALDPRVDSDRDGSGTAARHGAAYPAHGQGQTAGYGGYEYGYGQPVNPTGGNMNAGGLQGGLHHRQGGVSAMASGSGPGPAPNTAGPHRSDLLNKLDPRVDSKTGLRKDREPGYTDRRGI